MRIIQEQFVNTRRNYKLIKTRDKFRVIERRPGDVWITIQLVNGESIELPDFDVTISSRRKYIDGDITDGEDIADVTPRRVYLSPQCNYIFIEKHLNTTTNVGNIYYRHEHGATLIKPYGLRFDDACLKWYCDHNHMTFASLTPDDGYSREVFLMAWQNDHIGVFDVSASNSYYARGPRDLSVFFRIYFDFRHKRFVHAHPVKPWRG